MTEHHSPPIPDDAELLRRSRRSAGAFRAFYDRHATELHAFLLRRTRDRDAAFALTAETFAQAWLSRERFVDRGDGAAPWLFGIARNLLRSSVRARAIESGGRRRNGLDVATDIAAPEERWLDDLDEALASALAAAPAAEPRVEGPTKNGKAVGGPLDYRGSKQVIALDGRVAGGCIGQDRRGRHWDCWMGELAVKRAIISRDFLGEPVLGPGVG